MNSAKTKQKLAEYAYIFDVTDKPDIEGPTERFSVSVLATSFVDAYNEVRLAAPPVDQHTERKVVLRSINAYVRPVNLAPIAPPPMYPTLPGAPVPYPTQPQWVT